MMPKNRIPELDILRGFCILCMIAVHLIYNLTEIYCVFPAYPAAVLFLKNRGGIVFFLLSGVCATLGHRSLRRGITVLICAVTVSAVAAAIGNPIRFGVLHALGSCMILWTWLQRLPRQALPLLSFFLIATGALFDNITVSVPFLYPIGLRTAGFSSADYFPLFPYLGYFLAGVYFGLRLYPARRSLLPAFSFTGKFSRLLSFCGRHSLPLYLLHQPVLIAAIEAVLFLRRRLP